MGVSTLIFHIPAGQFIDRTHSKPLVTSLASLLMAIMSLLSIWMSLLISPLDIDNETARGYENNLNQTKDSAWIFGVISILVIVDLTRGPGHFNVAGSLNFFINYESGFLIQTSQGLPETEIAVRFL